MMTEIKGDQYFECPSCGDTILDSWEVAGQFDGDWSEFTCEECGIVFEVMAELIQVFNSRLIEVPEKSDE